MSKNNFEKCYSAIEKNFSTTMEARKKIKSAIADKIERAEGELKALDGVEFLQIANGSEEDLDEILLKREIIERRIAAYKAELSKTNSQEVEKVFGNIYRDSLALDRESEKEAADEIRGLLLRVAEIITQREKERTKVNFLRQMCIDTSIVASEKMLELENLYSLINAGSDVLVLRNELQRSGAFRKLSGDALPVKPGIYRN